MKISLVGFLLAISGLSFTAALSAAPLNFPQGTATPSEACGKCHQAIYNEFAHGFGADSRYAEITLKSATENKLNLPAGVSGSATAHAFAGIDPFPVHAREVEEGGRLCNVCHYPEAFAIPDLNVPEMTKPKPRSLVMESGGLTCASCHLTPEGKIRAAHDVKAPHETVADPAIQTSAMCAYCHSMGKRVVSKQTQTFLEWRDDFYRKRLGRQQCQDCHMPRPERKVAENSDAPVRAVARHLWTGGRSLQRLQSALSLVTVQPDEGKSGLELHVINIGAGHSVPTGSNRRAIYLIADVVDNAGRKAATKEWMFAPWYGNRPDDKSFLDEDKKRPDAVAAAQEDAQGPHENIIRAGEERVLSWSPELKAGEYTVTARLVYDLNRYNDRSFMDDQTEFNKTSLVIKVK